MEGRREHSTRVPRAVLPGLCHPPCSDPVRSLPGRAAPVQELGMLPVPSPGAFNCCGTFPCSATCRGRSCDLRLLFQLFCFPLAFACPLHLLPPWKGPAGCPGSVRPGGQCCPGEGLATQRWQCPQVTVPPSPALLSPPFPYMTPCAAACLTPRLLSFPRTTVGSSLTSRQR